MVEQHSAPSPELIESHTLHTRGGRVSEIVYDASVAIIGIVIAVVTIYPVYFVVSASFSSPAAVVEGRAWLFPSDVTLIGYQKVFEDSRVWIGYRNTILYTFFGTLWSLTCTLPAAFALSRKELPLRAGIMFFFIFTIFFNGGLIPTYFVVQSVGLVDSPLVMIVPFALNVFNLIIARTFFQNSIPEELFEASKMDGCSYTTYFFRIVLPLSRAIIAVLALYYAVWYWNEFFIALIYLRNKNLVSLQLVLRAILVNSEAFEETGSMSNIEQRRLADVLKYALILVSTLPVMAMYPFIQRHFTKGVMIGSLKG
jgi:putative aldouronate transport system permease protein